MIRFGLGFAAGCFVTWVVVKNIFVLTKPTKLGGTVFAGADAIRNATNGNFPLR
jgi:hypothetical protein